MKKNDQILGLIDNLNELQLVNMAATLDSLYHSKDFDVMDKIQLLDEIITAEYNESITKKYQRRLKCSNLCGSPCLIDNCVDSNDRVYLPQEITNTLSTLEFIQDGLNVCILGPSDSGKSYLAKALGILACTKYRVVYQHCEQFIESLASLKQTNYDKFQKKMRYYIKLDLLILDDFLLHTITDEREVKVLFEVMEKRSELSKSTIVCSQREPTSWKSMMLNDEVSANSIFKRATKHYTMIIKPQN